MNAVDEGSAAVQTSRTFDGSTSTLAEARQMVADTLSGAFVAAESIERARLVVSELASNAIEFAPGVDYTVTVECAERAIAFSITVRSRADLADIPADGTLATDEPGHLVLRGRGLAIVRTLSQSMTFSQNPDGTLDIVAVIIAGS